MQARPAFALETTDPPAQPNQPPGRGKMLNNFNACAINHRGIALALLGVGGKRRGTL
jgi:hypothetical protein